LRGFLKDDLETKPSKVTTGMICTGYAWGSVASKQSEPKRSMVFDGSQKALVLGFAERKKDRRKERQGNGTDPMFVPLICEVFGCRSGIALGADRGTFVPLNQGNPGFLALGLTKRTIVPVAGRILT
jgi:hypothetical protein